MRNIGTSNTNSKRLERQKYCKVEDKRYKTNHFNSVKKLVQSDIYILAIK